MEKKRKAQKEQTGEEQVDAATHERTALQMHFMGLHYITSSPHVVIVQYIGGKKKKKKKG